jgi:hypothetical protein
VASWNSSTGKKCPNGKCSIHPTLPLFHIPTPNATSNILTWHHKKARTLRVNTVANVSQFAPGATNAIKTGHARHPQHLPTQQKLNMSTRMLS